MAFGYDRSSQCPLRAVGFHSREEELLVVGAGGLAGLGLCDGGAEPVDAGQDPHGFGCMFGEVEDLVPGALRGPDP